MTGVRKRNVNRTLKLDMFSGHAVPLHAEGTGRQTNRLLDTGITHYYIRYHVGTHLME